MCITPTSLYIESMQKHYFGYFAKGGILYPFFGLAGLLVTIYVLIQIYVAIKKETYGLRKNRLKYLFAGFGMMGFMNGLNIFPTLGLSVYPPGNLSFIPLVIFAVGLFKHDLLDMGIIIKKSIIYSLLTASLTCLYALIIISADRAFENLNFSDSIFFQILFFFFIAFVFGPLKSKIQILVDRVFYKGKYDYQKAIKDVSQMIVSVLDYNKIASHVMNTIGDAMLIDHCELFLRDKSGSAFEKYAGHGRYNDNNYLVSMTQNSPLIDYMKNTKKPVIREHLTDKEMEPEAPGVKDILSDMRALNADLALPMIFKDNLNGFIVTGKKLSGDFFSYEDMDLLVTLSSQCALAIENARSYKIINDLNISLENRVEERTRALKEALSEKEQTQEQLIRSESLASIGQLVAGVAHELNNPLTSVTSLVQSTIEDIQRWDKHNPLDENVIEDLNFADKELKRARSIVTSLLGLSRQTQAYSEAVNINAVIKDALKILFNQYKHADLDIVETYTLDLPNIQGNFANLGQVVLNIIQNAIQAVINIKGTIFLSTRYDHDTGQVVFSCRDTGPGIPEPIKQDIFKPFFTTKEVGKGTGLGLYICHEIIQKHKGTLTLEETDDVGAGFEVRLPSKADE
jgi:two-component system NtrC family sensor kinase